MSLRIATFNANNLFERPALFQLPGVSAQANQVLKDIEKLQELLAETSYAGSIGTQIVAILEKYNFHTSPKNPFFTINEMRGKKLIRVKTSPKRIELVAKGRDDWFGTIDLIREVVPAASTDNTGRVIQAVRANILCLVEIESRLTLKQFSDTVLKKLKSSFPHNMLIDGNDPRGIDIGLYSQFEIASIRSHIDDSIGQTSRIFSRDCPEYEVKLPSGRSLWMLCNHFKSKGGPGPQATKDARRKRQRFSRYGQGRKNGGGCSRGEKGFAHEELPMMFLVGRC